MKKTLPAIGILLALLLLVLPGAVAVGSQTLAAAYVQAEILYVYYENTDEAAVPQLNSRMPDQMVALADAGERVTYLLVVDRSDSTRNYLNSIRQLVDALDEDTPGCVFRLCGFSDNFSADTTEYDAGALKTALDGLTFKGNTDIFYGVSQAAQSLLESQWKKGELYNLILLTDGWSSGAESEPPALEDTLPFVLHTYVLGGGGSPNELAQLQSMSNGAFVTGGSGEDAGRTIAARVNGMAAYTFSLEPGESEPYKLFFTREGSPEITSLSGLHVANGMDQPGVQTLPETDADASEPADEPVPSPTEEIKPSATDFPGNGQDASDILPGEESSLTLSGWLIAVLAVMCVLLLAVIALLVVLLLRRRPRTDLLSAEVPTHTPATVPGTGTIPMQLELLDGKTVTRENRFYLKDWMVIGSGMDCDLVLDDPDAAPRHSRIFFREGYLYIEDLDTKTGTALGGMRLYAPNRLRSGDEITIGETTLRFLF